VEESGREEERERARVCTRAREREKGREEGRGEERGRVRNSLGGRDRQPDSKIPSECEREREMQSVSEEQSGGRLKREDGEKKEGKTLNERQDEGMCGGER